MTQKTKSILALAIATLIAAPAFAQDAAPAAAPEAAPAAAPADAAAPAPADAAAPAPTTDAAASPAPEGSAPPPAEVAPPAESDKDKCVLGELCFGPVLTGGVFNVIGVGVHARYGDYWGFGLDYQFFGLSAKGVDASLGLFTLDGRLYPFGGAFFLSAGFSLQTLSLEVSTTSTAGKTKITGDLSLPQIKLGLGWMGHDGFVMGIDLALGIPLGSKGADIKISNGATTDPMVAKKVKDVNDASDAFVDLIPLTFQLNLLRIGYLF
ncbi:MAG TPA: hypothetical protein VHM19_13930 [Polyangiales bacterium]|jgi:hypothetical protein|nr:hypothetical protein [Polyangiales bacterium]